MTGSRIISPQVGKGMEKGVYNGNGSGSRPSSTSRKQRAASPRAGSSRADLVYWFAGLYLGVLVLAWLLLDKLETDEFLSHSALILGAIGLYQAPSPGNGRPRKGGQRT